jgi:RNA exonuclease NGL2
LHYSPTVACLQEVDRIEYHGPILRDAGYDFAYQKGYSAKLHGLCIAWKADIFDKAAEKFVKLDDATFERGEDISSDDSTRLSKRTGCSRVTRNLGLFVALKFKQDRSTSQPEGIIFTTRK